MQDFIRPLQQVKQKHQLTFNVMRIARLCSQNKDKEAIDNAYLDDDHKQDFNTCLETVRARISALQKKLDEKRELWQRIYDALCGTKTEIKSENLKSMSDEIVDQGKDLKEASKEYHLPLSGKMIDKIMRDTIPKDDRRKSLQLGAKPDDQKRLVQINVEPREKRLKQPS